jgi:hypothetical protein
VTAPGGVPAPRLSVIVRSYNRLPALAELLDRLKIAVGADRIEELNRAVLDLTQYVSSADLGFYIEPETRKVLNEIGEKDDN